MSAAVMVAAAVFGGLWAWKGRTPPPPPMLEATVRTDPPGLTVALDGRALSGERIRFSSQGPFGRLTVSRDCRTAEHVLSPADAGREVVLVPDPSTAEVLLEGGAPGATVRVNGGPVLPAPASVTLDLCRENRIEIQAPGHRPAEVLVPSGATPTQARTAVAVAAPEAIPSGRLRLERPPVPGTITVDGRQAGAGRDLELPAGTHALRLVSEDLWLDLRQEIEVPAGGTVTADWPVPGLADLAVQAFPSNCRVYLRRKAGQPWRYVDETPVSRKVAPGDYQVKVEYAPTGEAREIDISLRAGANPPVRTSFGGAR